MAEEKPYDPEPEDLSPEFTEDYLKMARNTFKETNPGLAKVLEKYANPKRD